MNQNKTVKIRVNATFHRLQINKNIKFQTKIQWKRHQNKIETRLVNHEHGFSVFEETIFLDFNLVYNESKGVYEDKNTQIVAVIMYQGKIKSGGYAKYNIAQVINNYLDGKIINIPLTQCPDPNANIEVTFTYQSLNEQGDTPRQQTPYISILNASSRDLNMSRIDFHDDKLSMQMDRINATINKLGQLAQTIKTKQKSSSQKIPQLIKRIQQLQGQRSVFLQNIQKLQTKFQQKQKQFSQKSKKDQKVIADLEKQLTKKDKDNKSKAIGQFQEQKKSKQELMKKEKQLQKYKKMYEQTNIQLEHLKNKQIRGSIGFKMQVDDVHQIAKFQEKQESSKHQIQRLVEQNTNLQIKVATDSFRIAQLFNAAYEIGGGKLLDELQKAIGLIES